MTTIFRKTAEGQSEIETRSHHLVPRLRSALIMVDGKRSDDELRKLIGPQADETLQTLLQQALIEAVAVAPPARVPAKPGAMAGAAVAAAPQARNFETLRRDAVRELTELVGPMGELVALKMEGARDASELRPLLDLAVQVIQNTRGSGAALEYTRRFLLAPA
ncbi:MAG TPA: hypothetical protein VGQ91_13205 [Ideonella sp.]|jgi:hypothetical protein|nr:hypothetical protein [Ideonella sp.]